MGKGTQPKWWNGGQLCRQSVAYWLGHRWDTRLEWGYFQFLAVNYLPRKQKPGGLLYTTSCGLAIGHVFGSLSKAARTPCACVCSFFIPRIFHECKTNQKPWHSELFVFLSMMDGFSQQFAYSTLLNFATLVPHCTTIKFLLLHIFMFRINKTSYCNQSIMCFQNFGRFSSLFKLACFSAFFI